MWRCGLEVLKDYPELEEETSPGGRGCRGGFSAVGQEAHRKPDTIKRWVDLVETVGKTEEEFEDYPELEGGATGEGVAQFG